MLGVCQPFQGMTWFSNGQLVIDPITFLSRYDVQIAPGYAEHTVAVVRSVLDMLAVPPWRKLLVAETGRN